MLLHIHCQQGITLYYRELGSSKSIIRVIIEAGRRCQNNRLPRYSFLRVALELFGRALFMGGDYKFLLSNFVYIFKFLFGHAIFIFMMADRGRTRAIDKIISIRLELDNTGLASSFH